MKWEKKTFDNRKEEKKRNLKCIKEKKIDLNFSYCFLSALSLLRPAATAQKFSSTQKFTAISLELYVKEKSVPTGCNEGFV